MINWTCAVTKGCLCRDKTIYQCMKMFKFKDLQSTLSFYGHCSFTYLWNMHLTQIHDGIHNATVVINALQNLLFCISPARPSDCPHLSVHLSHGWINQKRLVKIMQFSPFHRTVNPYLQFLRYKFHSEILADSPESNKGGDVNELFSIALCRIMRRYLEKKYKIKIVHSHY